MFSHARPASENKRLHRSLSCHAQTCMVMYAPCMLELAAHIHTRHELFQKEKLNKWKMRQVSQETVEHLES